MSDRAELPPGLVAYRRTPVFDEQTMPAGLRREHRTKAGVWAMITVLEGRLHYRTFDPCAEQVLTSDAPGIAGPEQPHEVELEGSVRFFLEFYRTDDQSDVG